MTLPPPKTGFARIVAAAGYSREGLIGVFKAEAAFRQEVAALIVLAPLAWWLGRTPVERALLVGVWLAVMVVELLNSALEATLDMVQPERHPLCKLAKDAGSAAVAVAIVAALGVWGAVAMERFF